MDINTISELAKIIQNNRLSKIEIIEGDTKILIEAADFLSSNAEVRNLPELLHHRKSESLEAAPAENGLAPQKAPLVGTVYLSPKAGAEPFVKKGQEIKEGDTICVVESMKLFNEIVADQDGIIAEVCVQNGQIVEFGQTLFMIEPIA